MFGDILFNSVGRNGGFGEKITSGRVLTKGLYILVNRMNDGANRRVMGNDQRNPQIGRRVGFLTQSLRSVDSLDFM